MCYCRDGDYTTFVSRSGEYVLFSAGGRGMKIPRGGVLFFSHRIEVYGIYLSTYGIALWAMT